MRLCIASYLRRLAVQFSQFSPHETEVMTNLPMAARYIQQNKNDLVNTRLKFMQYFGDSLGEIMFDLAKKESQGVPGAQAKWDRFISMWHQQGKKKPMITEDIFVPPAKAKPQKIVDPHAKYFLG